MGSNWSWPCSERERKQYKVKITNSKKKYREESSPDRIEAYMQVYSVNSLKLDEYVMNLSGEYFPCSIVQHPAFNEESLVFCQKLNRLTAFDARPGSYIVTPFSFSGNSPAEWAKLLKNYVTNASEDGDVVIGAPSDSSGGFYLCNFKYETPGTKLSKFRVIHIKEKLSKEKLIDVLSNNKGFRLRVGIPYRKQVLLLMEKVKPVDKEYTIYQYHGDKIESMQFQSSLVKRLDKYVAHNYQFEAAMSTPGSLYLIFSK